MWIVEQTFETVGDLFQQQLGTEKIAEQYAANVRAAVVSMVSTWTNEPSSGVGYANEIAAWNRAHEMSGDSDTYTREAAEYIAAQAVEIAKV